jgi:hypothetical protein
LKLIPLPGDIAGIFLFQARACDELGSPFTAGLCRFIANSGVPDGPVYRRLSEWGSAEKARADAIALRLAGALHNLVLTGKSRNLAEVYPPALRSESELLDRVVTATIEHGPFIDRFLDSPPQTNETARSAVLLPAFLYLRNEFALPFDLFELGSSAGLNQNWHRFRYEYGSWQWGDPGSPITIGCAWEGGNPPEPASIDVSRTVGCDIAPVPTSGADDRHRLMSYVWPDQPVRLNRLKGALEIATDHPPAVSAEPAPDWIGRQLERPLPGHLRVVFHTIMWQYMSAADQRSIRNDLKRIGGAASPNSPLAWLRLEPDGERCSAVLHLTMWNGAGKNGETIQLGRGDFHGRWIRWNPRHPSQNEED